MDGCKKKQQQKNNPSCQLSIYLSDHQEERLRQLDQLRNRTDRNAARSKANAWNPENCRSRDKNVWLNQKKAYGGKYYNIYFIFYTCMPCCQSPNFHEGQGHEYIIIIPVSNAGANAN